MREVIMLDEYDFSNAKPNPFAQRLREQATIMLEPDVLQAVQQRASQDNLSVQQEINQILRHYLQNQSIKLEDLLRKVIREELHAEQNLGRA
jgi:hypothetical protein